MKIAKLLGAALALLSGAGLANAGTLDEIAKRGELRVAGRHGELAVGHVDQLGHADHYA